MSQPQWSAICPDCLCDDYVVACQYLRSYTPMFNWGTPNHYWKCPACNAEWVQFGDGDLDMVADLCDCEDGE